MEIPSVCVMQSTVDTQLNFTNVSNQIQRAEIKLSKLSLVITKEPFLKKKSQIPIDVNKKIYGCEIQDISMSVSIILKVE